MDYWSKLGFALAVGGIGISIAAFFATYVWRDITRWIAIAGFATGLGLCVAAVICFEVIPEPTEPEVTLRFVQQEAPYLQVLNISKTAASNIKWMIAAVDLDNLGKGILHIPTTEFDFITSDNNSLPINLFGPPTQTSYIVKSGDRIIGSAGINCPACRRGHTFIFFITLGKGGWFAERKDVVNGNVVFPNRANQIDDFRELIEATPKAEQIQIDNLPGTE
jgi:hypothetical protein